MSTLSCYIASAKTEVKAKKIRRKLELSGIPCWIGRNKDTFLLFTVDPQFARAAKQRMSSLR